MEDDGKGFICYDCFKLKSVKRRI